LGKKRENTKKRVLLSAKDEDLEGSFQGGQLGLKRGRLHKGTGVPGRDVEWEVMNKTKGQPFSLKLKGRNFLQRSPRGEGGSTREGTGKHFPGKGLYWIFIEDKTGWDSCRNDPSLKGGESFMETILPAHQGTGVYCKRRTIKKIKKVGGGRYIYISLWDRGRTNYGCPSLP